MAGGQCVLHKDIEESVDIARMYISVTTLLIDDIGFEQ